MGGVWLTIRQVHVLLTSTENNREMDRRDKNVVFNNVVATTVYLLVSICKLRGTVVHYGPRSGFSYYDLEIPI